MDKPCIVGYALNAKKLRKSSHDCVTTLNDGGGPSIISTPDKRGEHYWKGGGLSDILESSQVIVSKLPCEPVTFVQLDYELPLASQPHCDVIIHKLTEDIDNPSKESVCKLSALDAYILSHPNTVIVDPIECVRRVISRARTCSHLSNIENTFGEQCPFTQPTYVIIEEGTSPLEIAAKLAGHGLSFPIICKPIQACGTPSSHNMMVIISKADLHLIDVPCVVQQYHDHDEALYKVYVIDQDVMVFKRQSLPNLLQRGAFGGSSTVRSLAFDSRKNYPTYADFSVTQCSPPAGHVPSSSARLNENISGRIIDACKSTAAAIRDEFGLTLFGFDAIVPNNCTCHNIYTEEDNEKCDDDQCCRDGRHAEGCTEQKSTVDGAALPKIVVIDVNYFPSYKEVPDFPLRLKTYLSSRMHNK